MRKKVLIIGIFLAVFGAAWGALYLMRGIEEPALEPAAAITEERQVSDSVHSYAAEDLAAGCRAEDKIFCAIEQVIKCTMAPELEGCDKEYVPGFVLGKAEETPRRGISRLRLPKSSRFPAVRTFRFIRNPIVMRFGSAFARERSFIL